MNQTILIIGIVIFFMGMICFSLGRSIFKGRALLNKKAWNGATKPLLVLGVLLGIIGLIIIVLTMPK